MNWKEHYEWRLIPFKDIRPGMLAKLIADNSECWVPNAWIKDRQGQVFEILRARPYHDNDGTEQYTITVKTDRSMSDEGECAAEHKHFLYKENGIQKE